MNLLTNRRLPVIPLFGHDTGHSFVPTQVRTAVARGGSPGRPSGWRLGASPLTAASTMAALRSLGTMLCFVTILASTMLLNGAAHAERVSQPTHRASGEALHPLAAFVTEASRRFGVPEHWIRAVMHVESSAKQRARSSKGAMGLMQIMPGSWKELRARHGLGTDPYDPHDNILAGTAYIRELHDRYGAPGFLAAYNAGPGRYERHLATGRSLPDETQAFVATLTPMIKSKWAKVQIGIVARSFAWANSSLFATRTASISPDGRLPVADGGEPFNGRLLRPDTKEATEQRKATSGGGRGGKGLTQGEQPTGGRGSDTEPSCHVDPIGGCAPERMWFHAVRAADVRPEGGARCVSSARRDLCGGRGEILVPTATLRLTFSIQKNGPENGVIRVNLAPEQPPQDRSVKWSHRLSTSDCCPY